MAKNYAGILNKKRQTSALNLKGEQQSSSFSQGEGGDERGVGGTKEFQKCLNVFFKSIKSFAINAVAPSDGEISTFGGMLQNIAQIDN